MLRASSIALAAMLALASLASSVRAETVELMPGGPGHWGMRDVVAPFSSLVLGPGHWYGERTLEVETTPPDAAVDLFYVRAGFQKRFEQADAPVTVRLPRRIDAHPGDVVIVRAFAEGYGVTERTVKVGSRTDEILLELEPLPNVLRAVAHTYFAGRASLELHTAESLSLRVQETEGGFQVALHETARDEGVEVGGLGGPLLGDVKALQLGEDLVVQVSWGAAVTDGEPELRSRQSRDPIRDVHVYSIEAISSEWTSGAGVERTRDALAQIGPEDVSGCALAFERSLREALDPAALSRALAPRGRFTDPYIRAAIRRLGQVWPGGAIELTDGSRFSPDSSIQLSAAHNQAAEVRGLLALLRGLVARLEPDSQRRAVLHGLIAPELSASAFASAHEAAADAERRCEAEAGPS